MTEIPCNECIVLGICKATVQRYKDVAAEPLVPLFKKCSLIQQYILQNCIPYISLFPNRQDLFKKDIRHKSTIELLDFYGLKREEILDSLRNKYD